jgi:hypothetical protein
MVQREDLKSLKLMASGKLASLNVSTEVGNDLVTKVNVKGEVVPVLFLSEHHTMREYWGVDV